MSNSVTITTNGIENDCWSLKGNCNILSLTIQFTKDRLVKIKPCLCKNTGLKMSGHAKKTHVK